VLAHHLAQVLRQVPVQVRPLQLAQVQVLAHPYHHPHHHHIQMFK